MVQKICYVTSVDNVRCDHSHAADCLGTGTFAGGRELDGLCQQVDIAPALLELAGATVPETMEARSLLPALELWAHRLMD